MVAHTLKKKSIRKKGEKTKKHRSHGSHNRTYKRNMARHGGVNSDNENNNVNNSDRSSGYENYSNALSHHVFEGRVAPLSRNDKRWLRIAKAFFQTRPHDVPEEFFEDVMNNSKMDNMLYDYKKWRLNTFAFEFNIRYTHGDRKHLYNLFKVFEYIERKYKRMHRRMNDKLWETRLRLHVHMDAEWTMLVNERRDRILQQNNNNDNNDSVRNSRPLGLSSRKYQTRIARLHMPIENAIYQDAQYSNNSSTDNNNMNND